MHFIEILNIFSLQIHITHHEILIDTYIKKRIENKRMQANTNRYDEHSHNPEEGSLFSPQEQFRQSLKFVEKGNRTNFH